MTVEQNKALMMELAKAFNANDKQRLRELVSDDFVGRSPGVPDQHGSQGYEEFLSTYRSAFPDLHIEIKNLIAEGDQVVVDYTWTGTHQGEFLGIAPTGRRVSVPSISIVRFKGDKLVEDVDLQDNLNLFQQLGIEVETKVREATR